MMFYKDFSVQIGLVNVEYTCIELYKKLHVDLPIHLSPDQVWTQILQGHETYVCGTSKVSTLRSLVFYYLHVVLSPTLIGQGDSTGVMNIQGLYFLWSMVARELIHIGHMLAYQLRH